MRPLIALPHGNLGIAGRIRIVPRASRLRAAHTVPLARILPNAAIRPGVLAARAVPRGPIGLLGRHRLPAPRRALSSFIPPAPPPPVPTTTGTAGSAYPPASPGGVVPRTLAEASAENRVKLIVSIINNMLIGKLNVSLLITLAPNAVSTTIIDRRIGATTGVLFSPLTANAAAEMAAGTLYVSSQKSGQATIAHASNGQTDRNFRLLLIG